MRQGGGDDGVTSSAPPATRRRRPELSATQRALALLSRREHSRQELARKLTSRGVEPEDARVVIDKLSDAGWQDDARFAELLVRSRANTGYGPVRIAAELGTHRLATQIIDAAMESFEVDWLQNASDLLRRRHRAALIGDRAAQRKAADFLLRRGFTMDQVMAALRSNPDE